MASSTPQPSASPAAKRTESAIARPILNENGDVSSEVAYIPYTSGLVSNLMRSLQSDVLVTKELAMDGVLQLANANSSEARKREVFTQPGLLDLIETIICTEPPAVSDDLVVRGVMIFLNLTQIPEARTHVLSRPALMNRLIVLAQDSTVELDARESAIRVFSNIAYELEDNARRLYEHLGLINSLKRMALSTDEEQIQVDALEVIVALSNLITPIMLNDKELLDILVKTIAPESNKGAKLEGLSALTNLTSERGCEKQLAEHEGLAEGLLKVLRSRGETAAIRTEALRVVWNLTNSVEVANALPFTAELISILKDEPLTFIRAALYLNLATASGTRELLLQEKDLEDVLNQIGRKGKVEKTYSTLASIILFGVQSVHIGSCDETFFKSITSMINGAIHAEEILFRRWPLVQPLMGLVHLTTLERNRQVLGVEWINSIIPNAISFSLDQNDATSVEYALLCIQNFAEDLVWSTIKVNQDLKNLTQRVVSEKTSEVKWSEVVRLAMHIVSMFGA